MYQKIFLIIIFVFLSINFAQAKHNIAGRILLQVEQNGEAFYFHPESLKLHFLGRPDDAFKVMREQGIGISNANLLKIEVADTLALKNTFSGIDSDGDGFDDYTELINDYNPYGEGRLSYDLNFTRAHQGKIFLQVENNGEAWYINPVDNKRYFLGRPADAFEIMRTLGLGISNDNLDKLMTINEEKEEEKQEDEIPDEQEELDPNLAFAYNLFMDCQEMSLELSDESVLYSLTNLGKSESGNYCRIELRVLNNENLANESMICQTPTIYHYLSEVENNGEISKESVTDNDYLNYVSWLPMMYLLDVKEHAGEGNCQGPLVSLLEEGSEPIVNNLPISNDLNWQLINDSYVLDLARGSNSLYFLSQTGFSSDNTVVAINSYSNGQSSLVKESSDMINKIFVDNKNRLWAYNNINGNGLHFLVNNTWFKFTAENSDLETNNIYHIAENGSGLWLATDIGLYLFKNANWTLYTYQDWDPEDSLEASSIGGLQANLDYLVFSTNSGIFIYRDNAFIKLDGLSGKNIFLQGVIAWFYNPLSYMATQLNLDDFSAFNLEIDPALENLGKENFNIVDISFYDNSFWILVTPRSDSQELVIVNLKDNTTYYYYSNYSQARYAKQLLSFNGDLYVLFSNGYGLYQISL